jgi:hypothetical protein
MYEFVQQGTKVLRLICVGWAVLGLNGCLAWGKHELLPPAQYVSPLVPLPADSVHLYREGEMPKRACIRIAKVAAHGNAYATSETLEDAIRFEAASIGADYVAIISQQVTKDETISSFSGGWGWGSMWGTAISEQIQRPHLYGIACRSAAVRFGAQADKEWKVQYIYRNTTADRLGLKIGDKVLAVNGRFLAADIYAIDQEVLVKRPGESITVEYLTNDGMKITKDIILEEWR